MNILITGGFGFIGSNLMKRYLSFGHSVSVIDDLSTACISSYPGVEFFKIDLSRPSHSELAVINSAIQKSDLIFHMASAVGVKVIDQDPQSAIRKNGLINHHLFPLFEKHQKKVIFASSSEVYGETEEARETDVLKIGSPDVLRWGYACGKLMGEFLLKTYTFPHVIARFFNVTGKGQKNMVLPNFIERVKNNQDLTVYGNGLQYRSFCDIRDAVEMLVLLAENDVHNGETYNIGNSLETYTMTELAQMVISISDKRSQIQYRPYGEEHSLQSQDILKRKPNTEKIQRYYQAKFTIKDTIHEMLT
ncbi:NAD-dependent epimerase/dehydratase family protein [Peredibacter sp. HCB2-198]|uniref:NAD-dependent epimerase/dehydratase family protein n=1 Tax=Peredibacter sp. HCB2-198 TaxID=3383025 RepID=UPI0038B4B9C7